MATYESTRLGVSFTLKDDATQRSLEKFESVIAEILENTEKRVDSIAMRALVGAAFRAGWIESVEGGPQELKEVMDSPAKVIQWMAKMIDRFYSEIKNPDPESLRRQR